MTINLLNTAEGLKPLYDEDYDEKRKLRLGHVYTAQIRQPRNLRFHRLFFALIRCAWEYLDEQARQLFHNNQEHFRRALILQVGYTTPAYNITTGEWIETPRSISFDSMDEAEFNQLYNDVRDLLFRLIIPNITEEEFDRALAHF